MDTIKLSKIKNVVKIKTRDNMRGGAYFDIILDNNKYFILPSPFGYGDNSAVIINCKDSNAVVVTSNGGFKGAFLFGKFMGDLDGDRLTLDQVWNNLGFMIDLDLDA